MWKTLLFCTLVMALFTGTVPAADGPDFEEGKWEITVEIDMPGMPMKMPPNTYTRCMRRDNPVPETEGANQVCHTTDVRTEGNTVTWKLECTGAGNTMTGDGKITYQKDSLSGTMTMQGQGMTIKNAFKGKRVGACE